MNYDRRVIAALDDLARELFSYLERSSGAIGLFEDPQGSLYDTLKGLETTLPQRKQGARQKPAASIQEAINSLPLDQRDLAAVDGGGEIQPHWHEARLQRDGGLTIRDLH